MFPCSSEEQQDERRGTSLEFVAFRTKECKVAVTVDLNEIKATWLKMGNIAYSLLPSYYVTFYTTKGEYATQIVQRFFNEEKVAEAPWFGEVWGIVLAHFKEFVAGVEDFDTHNVLMLRYCSGPPKSSRTLVDIVRVQAAANRRPFVEVWADIFVELPYAQDNGIVVQKLAQNWDRFQYAEQMKADHLENAFGLPPDLALAVYHSISAAKLRLIKEERYELEDERWEIEQDNWATWEQERQTDREALARYHHENLAQLESIEHTSVTNANNVMENATKNAQNIMKNADQNTKKITKNATRNANRQIRAMNRGFNKVAHHQKQSRDADMLRDGWTRDWSGRWDKSRAPATAMGFGKSRFAAVGVGGLGNGVAYSNLKK
ncbi:hypothetical protein HK097_001523 [Rhizophlyctis rosea]|uniref:Uncharacterized protein n=1 Tax=Rhizophlyctis rosea TaxID=64517 RepID=A0AAD5X846_9FUNG|nr:hypothetical protein HK097_001523 [Rhizophlyctis rosea]